MRLAALTLLFSISFGLVAMILAGRVAPKVAAGDYVGAQRSATMSRVFSGVGIIVGAIYLIVWLTAQAQA